MELDPYLTPYSKCNSKRIKDRNVSAKSISLLEENIGVDLYNLGSGNSFLGMTTKPQATKGKKIDKLDFIKILRICASKCIIKQVGRQATEWEKIFGNQISDKSLVSRTYKELLQFNNKRQVTQLKNGLRIEETFFQ